MRSVPKLLHFPLGGLNRALSYRDSTAPSENGIYGTPLAMNVRGRCMFEGRLRGGSRPGLRNLGVDPSTLDGFVDAHPPAPDIPADVKGAVPPSPWSCSSYHRGRLFVASSSTWYCSATGDLSDWDYGADGEVATRAAFGNVALAGRPGGTIRAMFARDDNGLYIATDVGIWVLSGEPTNGQIRSLSTDYGCVSDKAWCRDGGARFYFLSSLGLCVVSADMPVTLVSGQIPDELKGLRSATLVNDSDANGIHILTDDGDWFYEIDSKAFWPEEYQQSVRPVDGAEAIVGGVKRTVFLCADGAWRWPDPSCGTDDGAAFASMVAIGPFRTAARDDEDGMLDSLSATLAADSDGHVEIEAYSSDSPECAVRDAMLGSPKWSFSFAAGRNRVTRPRLRGCWCVLVARSSGKWAYESVTAVAKQLGRLR